MGGGCLVNYLVECIGERDAVTITPRICLCTHRSKTHLYGNEILSINLGILTQDLLTRYLRQDSQYHDLWEINVECSKSGVLFLSST